jgi:hypothetical protein
MEYRILQKPEELEMNIGVEELSHEISRPYSLFFEE